MKLALQMTAAGFTALLLASCGSTGGSTAGNHPSGTGPFDSRGNYVEDWADSPSKWKRGGGTPSKPGESLVMNDEPPADSVPIPTAANTPQPGPISSTPVISRPATVRTSSTSSGSGATATRRQTTSSTASKPSTTSKPKPKTSVAAKPKAKKPTASRYTIRKGDTLSAIASRNKTTVGAIQRANGIKGSLIQPGKSLVIPK